jgi:menaquinone-dependent protoporphyrinogen oxidase
MGTKVLVTCASKRGSTAEIGEAVVDALHAEGVDAELRTIREARNLAPYDAVVVGSAVYATRWRSDAVSFLLRHRRALSERAVWLFQSGPLDRSAEETEIPLPSKVARIATEIDARGHATFGGNLGPDTNGWIAKKMVQNGHGGDFRNFDRIHEWGVEIAHALGASASA